MNSIQKIESAVYAIRPELITEDTTYEPITLSDILLCLDDIGIYGTDGAIVTGGIANWTGLNYNLRLSPYEQSEEVKDFIANNLSK